MSSGIYFIRNILNNKIYVGSAINFDRRWNTHIRQLRNNTHHCIHLQNAWNLDGEKHFMFEKIEYVMESWLIRVEQKYLDKYWDGGINCYNICKVADSRLGVPHDEEVKKRLSIVGKLRIGEKGNNSILTEQKVREIYNLILSGMLLIDIAKIYNVQSDLISNIKRGRIWKHIYDERLRNFNSRSNAKIGKNNPLAGKFNGDNPKTKLKEKQIILIKRLICRHKVTQKQIAKHFKVSLSTIKKISQNITWKYLNG